MNALLSIFYSDLLPILLQIIAAALGVLLLRLTNLARDYWGIEIEARHREALQSALMTGIKIALSRGLKGPDAISEATVHALQRGSPDAIEFFGLSLDDLKTMAEAKLRDAMNETPWFGIDVGKVDDSAPEAVVGA